MPDQDGNVPIVMVVEGDLQEITTLLLKAPALYLDWEVGPGPGRFLKDAAWDAPADS